MLSLTMYGLPGRIAHSVDSIPTFLSFWLYGLEMGSCLHVFDDKGFVFFGVFTLVVVNFLDCELEVGSGFGFLPELEECDMGI